MDYSSSTPLSELLESLERDGNPLPTWIAVHAPDHNLEAAWRAARDPRAMLGLMSPVDHVAAVRAACACLRPQLPHVLASEHRPGAAIDAVEAWCSGAAAPEQVAEAGFDAEDAVEAADVNAAGERDVVAVATTCQVALAAVSLARAVQCAPQHAGAFLAQAAYDAAVAAAIAAGDGSDRGTQAALVRLAEIARAHLPCPTLDALREAYRRS